MTVVLCQNVVLIILVYILYIYQIALKQLWHRNLWENNESAMYSKDQYGPNGKCLPYGPVAGKSSHGSGLMNSSLERFKATS